MLDNKNGENLIIFSFSFDQHLIWQQCLKFQRKQDAQNDKYWRLKMQKEFLPTAGQNLFMNK